MKSNIIKSIVVISLLILINIFTSNVYAAESDAKKVVKDFLSYVDDGNSYATIFIDSNNTELYNTAKDRIDSYSSVKYDITKVTRKDNKYKVDVKIKAEGSDWKVEGITVYFDVECNNDSYKITNTNFFDLTSPEFIAGMAISIVTLVFIIIAVVCVVIVVIVIIVVVIVVIINKKKKQK